MANGLGLMDGQAAAGHQPSAINHQPPPPHAMQRLRALYLEHKFPREFEDDLALLLCHGTVIATPDTFVMGRPVRHDAPFEELYDFRRRWPDADCWHVWGAAITAGGNGKLMANSKGLMDGRTASDHQPSAISHKPSNAPATMAGIRRLLLAMPYYLPWLRFGRPHTAGCTRLHRMDGLLRHCGLGVSGLRVVPLFPGPHPKLPMSHIEAHAPRTAHAATEEIANC